MYHYYLDPIEVNVGLDSSNPGVVYVEFPVFDVGRDLIDVNFTFSNSGYFSEGGEVHAASIAASFSSSDTSHYGGDYYIPSSTSITTQFDDYDDIYWLMNWSMVVGARDTSWMNYSGSTQGSVLNGPNGSFSDLGRSFNQDLFYKEILVPENKAFTIQVFRSGNFVHFNTGIYGDWFIDNDGIATLLNPVDYENTTTVALPIDGGTTFTFGVMDVNENPTNVILSRDSFNENIISGSAIAALTCSDPDAEDTHTYSLVSGSGDTDNNAFTVYGSRIKINESPDFETKSSYSIRVKTTDAGGLTFEKEFTLFVNDLEEGPLDTNDDGFVDEVTHYQMWTASGGVDLTNRRGRTYSDDTSRKWDAIKAVQVEAEFSVLVEGHRNKEGEYKVVSANEEGVINVATRWLNGNQMLDEGYEDLFAMDFNGNSQIGF